MGRVEKPEFDLGSDFLLARHLQTRRAQNIEDGDIGRDLAVSNVYSRKTRGLGLERKQGEGRTFGSCTNAPPLVLGGSSPVVAYFKHSMIV